MFENFLYIAQTQSTLTQQRQSTQRKPYDPLVEKEGTRSGTLEHTGRHGTPPLL
jgi:hypothetical protein